MEGDVKDDNAAYLDFLNEEVNTMLNAQVDIPERFFQAQKFNAVTDAEDDELEEESMLETPLDKIEPYGLFKNTLMSSSSTQSCHPHIEF